MVICKNRLNIKYKKLLYKNNFILNLNFEFKLLKQKNCKKFKTYKN